MLLVMRRLPAHPPALLSLLQEVHCQNGGEGGGEAQLERENDGGDNDEGAWVCV